jgi:3-hydroxyisobutyrate dehydrogenase-like beta-hydroxyacid dehydrogenase
MRWGFVGLGQMGLPMARRLAQVVDLTAHDPARDAADGLRLVPRARDLAPCDVLVTCLPNGDVVETVLFGPEGLAEALSPGAVVIDTSTTTHAALHLAHKEHEDRKNN